MQGDPAEDGRAGGVHYVVGAATGADPSQLMTHIGDQDEQRTDEGDQLPEQVEIHGVFTVTGWARRRSRTRLTAMVRGPSRAQPLAHLWPPPPKCSATAETLTAPLLRRLTRQRRSGNSWRKMATSTSP